MSSPRPLIGVVASALAGGVLFFALETSFTSVPHGRMPAGPEVAPEQAFEHQMHAVRALMKAGDWEAARRRLAALPEGASNGEALDAFRTCAREIESEQALARARRLLDSHLYGAVRGALNRVSLESTKADGRRKLEAELRAVAGRLLLEAQALSRHRDDRDKMIELQQKARELEELEPDLTAATELSELAAAALEEIDTPELVVRRAYDDGDVALALKKAKACAKASTLCEELVTPLSKLAAAQPKLKALGVVRLLELRELARGVSSTGEGLEPAIDELLTDRVDTVAQKCRAAGDWGCVDRQIAKAMDQDISIDDSFEDDLNGWAKETVTRAYSMRSKDPKAVRALLERVTKMTSVESRWRELALRLDEHVAAEP